MKDASPIFVAIFFIVVFALASIVFYDSHRKTRIKKLRLGRLITTKNLSALLFLLFILLLISAVGLASFNN